MVKILSYGGGVNSTAIIALAKLGELPMPDYIVFSDTGAEYPHTYKYIEHLESEGIRIIYLTGGTKDMTLIEWCQKKGFIPSRMNRWCTDYWKITPLRKFGLSFGDDYKMIIGIDAGESHRAKRRFKANYFPLVEMGIDRNGCKEIIRKAGLGVPQKSGCFICPYQRKRQWIELKKHHPELWEIAIDLEKKSMFRFDNFTYKFGMTIEDFVEDQDKQEELPFGIVLDQKCECYFD
jgi:hypothetical protein